jgi:NAD(P)-dependent dehydrogenase (short-subunit alcohol dehydrogenase family)
MTTSLKDKIILITGGNGFLGKAILKDLCKKGAFCVSMDINHETNEDLSNLNCDITNEESINLAICQLIKKYGRIDGLVNNAYPRTKDWGKKFEDIPLSSWRENVDWQLSSHFYVSQVVSSFMIKEKNGVIVNMASIYGVVGPDFSVYDGTEMTMPAAYSAIKGGLINFTRYLASYLGKHKIRVNAVSPGGIFDNQNEIFVSQYERKTPLRRMGTPEDISPVVSFLLSDDARYITGQNIIVDGGWTCI